MASYPGSQPTLTDPTSSNFLNQPSHSLLHRQVNDEIEAIAAELGLNPAGAYATVDARIGAIEIAVNLWSLNGTTIEPATSGHSLDLLTGSVNATLITADTFTTNGTGVVNAYDINLTATLDMLTTGGIQNMAWIGDNQLLLGDNFDTTKYIYARNGDANYPGLRYDSTTNNWQFSNDGLTWTDFDLVGAANVSAGANLTDNAIVRGDGGITDVQTSGVLIDDSDNVTGIVNLTTTGTVTFNGVTYTFPASDGANGTQLTTNGSGVLSWGSAAGTVFSDASFRIQDDGDATKEIAFEAVNITTATTRTITMPDADVNLGDIATNNAKVTNATHTGEVTGATTLTVDPTAITNKTTVVPESGDFVLFSDTSDSGNLKKADVSTLLGGGGSSETVTRDINQTTHGFSVGDWVRHNGTIYVAAQADVDANSDALGVVSAVAGVDDFTLQIHGYITGLSGLTAGAAHFLSDTVAGAITATPPADVGEIVKPVLIADSTTSGYINVMRGNEVQGSPAGIVVQDEGSTITSSVTSFDFVGAGVTATNVGDAVTVTIPGGGGGATLTYDVNQTTHGFSVNDWVYHNGTQYALADASAASTAEVVGIVSAVADANNFTVQFGGRITGLTGLTAGEAHFLSETAGAITATEPTTIGAISKPVLVADSTTSGFIFNMRGSEISSGLGAFNQSFVDGDLTAGVLTVTHNLGQQYVQVQVYNNNDDLIIPTDVTLTDSNNLDIDLNGFGTLTGTWHAVVLSIGATASSTATDLSLAGQAADDTAFFDGTNWQAIGGTEKVFAGSFTRDQATATGTQAITGVGFKPSSVIMFVNDPDDAGEGSWGFSDGTNNHCMTDRNNVTAGSYETNTSMVYILQSSGNTYRGDISTFDSDGFTISWTRTGTPTGVMAGSFIAYR